jgi:hypothetical protein
VENEVTLLLFNIMAIDFAMDVESVSAMVPVDSLANQKSGIVWFHEKINFPQTPVVYHCPKALRITSGKKQFHLVIDNPRDMPVAVPIDHIKPFPVLVDQFTAGTPLWAVYPLKERMVLLVDPLTMFP